MKIKIPKSYIKYKKIRKLMQNKCYQFRCIFIKCKNIFLIFRIFCILNLNDKKRRPYKQNNKRVLFDRNHSVCSALFTGCKNNPCKYGDCRESELDCQFTCACYPGFTGELCDQLSGENDAPHIAVSFISINWFKSQSIKQLHVHPNRYERRSWKVY